MRREVFACFCYLVTALLIGDAKAGTAHASIFAPADYWPQRLSDVFCRHQLSDQALMAHVAAVALIRRNFSGQPGTHVSSVEMAARRLSDPRSDLWGVRCGEKC